MNTTFLFIIVIIIIVITIIISKKGKIGGAKKRKQETLHKINSSHSEDILTIGQVLERKKELIETVESHLQDRPEHIKQINTIISDWAEMKMQSFKDRRSWVRNPDTEKNKE